MPPIHRRSAMRVRDGIVKKKNNWAPDPGDYYARPQREIMIERVHPGAGYRHVLTVAHLRRFLELLPDWEDLAVGLRAISLWSGGTGWLGICNPGVIALAAWERELWWSDVNAEWVHDEAEMLDLLEVERVAVPSGDDRFELRWTESQARAYMLLDVLVHELGHHHDRMTSRGPDAPRGERYAVSYARDARAKIWPAYARTFGF
jgi:hypothetical protein